MANLQLKEVPKAKTGMLIRKPVADVFEAFINPNVTTSFGSPRAVVGSKSASS